VGTNVPDLPLFYSQELASGSGRVESRAKLEELKLGFPQHTQLKSISSMIRKSSMDDEQRAIVREQFFAAVRSLAASADSIQTRVADAARLILLVTIDDFENSGELKIKFARLLDIIATDNDDPTTAEENIAHMTDLEASRAADLICDFYSELS
jgi:hypothetical protein